MRVRLRANQGVAEAAVLTVGVQALIYIVGFVCSVFVAHAVGPRGRGAYYVPVTVAAASVSVLSLSVGFSQSYFFGEGKYNLAQLSRTTAALGIGVAPLGLAIMSAVYVIAPHSVLAGTSTTNYAIAAMSVPFQVSLIWLSGLYVLGKHIVRSQLAMLIGAVVQLCSAAALYLTNNLGVRAVLILYLIAVVLPWALHMVWLEDFAPLRFQVDWRMLRRIMAFGLKLHPGYVMWFLLLRFDTFLVAAYLGVSGVGRYSLAVLFAELMWVLVDPLAVAVMPYQAGGTIFDAVPVTFKAVRFSLALSALLVCGFSASLWFLIPAIYGPAFGEAYPAFLALAPGIVAMTTVRPLYYWLVRQGRAWTLTGLSGAAFCVNVALNIVLLGPLGIVGAALASTVAYVGLSAAYVVWALRVAGTDARQAFRPRLEDLQSFTRLWRRAREMRHAPIDAETHAA